jgi:hypothetical protein
VAEAESWIDVRSRLAPYAGVLEPSDDHELEPTVTATGLAYQPRHLAT